MVQPSRRDLQAYDPSALTNSHPTVGEFVNPARFQVCLSMGFL